MYKSFLFSIALVATTAIAQQLPNAGFESWDAVSANQQDKPTNWNTVNSSLGSLAGTIDKTCFETLLGTNKAIMLKTVSGPIFSPDVNGIATTGDVITTPPYGVEGGISFNHKPDSLVGYYMYMPVTGDIGTIEMVLKTNNEDTIAHARFETPSSGTGSLTRFSTPFVYNNNSTPDIAAALLSSSDGYDPKVGSQLFVDDLELIYNPASVAINELPSITKKDVWTYAGNVITNANVDQNSFKLYDLTGKQLNPNQSLKTGIYFYTVASQNASGKLLVQ